MKIKILLILYIISNIIFISCDQLWSQQKEDKIIPIILKPIKTVYPKYPDHLKKEEIGGEVIVCVWVNKNGKVRIAKGVIRSLHPELDKLAVSAAKEWQYEPLVSYIPHIAEAIYHNYVSA